MANVSFDLRCENVTLYQYILLSIVIKFYNIIALLIFITIVMFVPCMQKCI